jgi:hypothetical protein
MTPKRRVYWMLWFAFLALLNAVVGNTLVALLMVAFSCWAMFLVWGDIRQVRAPE